MPEGDTIHKIAAAIAPRLAGKTLEDFTLRGAPDLQLAGRRVESVEAQGKHLFITVEGEHLLRTHLGLHGSWHRYSPGETWKRPERQASVVLRTKDDVFVCFLAKEAECLRAGGARAAEVRRRLGPDLAGAQAPDWNEIVQRARRLVDAEAPIVDALLHQGVACGMGNVYKCEVLFLHGLHPRRRVDSIDAEELGSVFETARRLLRANLGGGARITRDLADGAGQVWVYGRRDAACLKCPARIEHARLGKDRRVTYWCPQCQC